VVGFCDYGVYKKGIIFTGSILINFSRKTLHHEITIILMCLLNEMNERKALCLSVRPHVSYPKLLN